MRARAAWPFVSALALGSCVLPALEVDESIPEPGEAGSTASGGASSAGKGGGSGTGGSSGKGGSAGTGGGTGGDGASAGAGGSDMAGTSGSSSGSGGGSGAGAAGGAGGSHGGAGGTLAGTSGAGGSAGSAGAPVTCEDGLTPCGNACRDLSSDRENCGECGMACAGVLGCFGGECGCDPEAPDAGDVTRCSDKCSVLTSDPENCGECGTKCGAGEVCEMGTCVSMCTPAVAGPPAITLIEDFEDGNLSVGDGSVTAVPSGYWWFAHDDTIGMVTPDPLEVTAPGWNSSHALAANGAGYTDWGANIGASLNSQNGIDCAIDASDFRGIAFAYRAAHPFSLRVSTVASMPRPTGVCPLGAPYCYNTYREHYPASAEWVEVEVLWEELGLHPGSPALDPATLVSLSFDFSAGEPFDLSFDDVRFVGDSSL